MPEMSEEGVAALEEATENFGGEVSEAELEQEGSDQEATSTEEESATSSEEEASEEAEEPEEQAGRAKPRSPRLQKILDKYGGDEDQLVDSIYESWNSLSDLNKRLQELEVQTRHPVQETPSEPDPAVLEVQENIRSLDSDEQRLRGKLQKHLDQMDGLNQKVYKTEGKLELVVDDDERTKLENELSNLQSRLQAVVDRYESDAERLGQMGSSRRSLSKKLQQAEAEARQRQAEELQQKRDDAQVGVETVRSFQKAIAEGKQSYSFVDPDHMAATVYAQMVIELQRRAQIGEPMEDVAGETKKLIDQYAKAQKAVERKKFTVDSKNKLSTQQGKQPARPGTARTTPTREDNAEIVKKGRANAARLLP